MIQQATDQVIIEYHLTKDDRGYWIVIISDREEVQRVGPFDSDEERNRAHADVLDIMRQWGAVDMPTHKQ